MFSDYINRETGKINKHPNLSQYHLGYASALVDVYLVYKNEYGEEEALETMKEPLQTYTISKYLADMICISNGGNPVDCTTDNDFKLQ